MASAQFRVPIVSVGNAVLATALLAICAPATAQEALSLNGTWKFAYASGEAEAARFQAFAQTGFDASHFDAVPVPSNWALQGYETPPYRKYTLTDGGQGFYLRTFTVPPSFADKRVILHFGGVWSSAEIWLNGKPLGRHDSGFTSFGYDVTSYLKTDGENVLAVRVREITHDYPFDANDDWILGGIYRDVSLEATPKDRWIDRVDIRTDFDAQYQDADLKARIVAVDHDKSVASGNATPPYTLRLTLLDADGSPVQRQEEVIPPHNQTDRETTITMHVAKPRRWTAETPDLYRLRVEMIEDGKVRHMRETTLGFRQIATAGGVFRVNGQAVKLRGVNRHDEYPTVGRATRPEDWLRDIRLMKAANINMVRMSHYPPAEGFLDLCDRIGLYVLDEIPMGAGGDRMNDPAFAEGALLRTYETIARDINHPSVIVWSVGNEDPLTAAHMATIRMTKAMDPTRPVLMPWRDETWLPPEIDILAPHYPTARELDALATASTRPIITTEYTHAFGDEGTGDLQARWDALTKHANGAGGAIWMWADQGLDLATRGPDGTFTHKLKVMVPDGWDGITDSYRNPTRDYWEAKAVYAPVFPTVEQVSVAPGQATVAIPIRNDQDFTDLGAVKIGWTLFEDAAVLAKATTTLSAAPHTSTDLSLPLAAIHRWKPGATYYAQIGIARPDGSEITRRSVELVSATPPPPPAASAMGTPSVTTAGDTTTIRIGTVRYTFRPATGQLESASLAGRALLGVLKPSAWRPINQTEKYAANKGETGRVYKEGLPHLNAYAAKASVWQVTSDATGTTLTANVRYTVDARNGFAVEYIYRVAGDGSLSVRYTMKPEVEARYLPFVGMALTTAAPMRRIRWLGRGPYDSFPNLRSATYLGVWSGAAGGPDVAGVKQTRTIDIDSAIHIANDGYIRSRAGDASHLDILSAVAGRPTKFGVAEDPAQQVRTDAAPGFSGSFTITLGEARR